jgi:hypothetical protein
VVRETRRGNRGARGDGSQFGYLGFCQRAVYCPKIVKLVFAHSESSAPVAVRCDPFRTGGRWRRQRQIEDSDSLPDSVTPANRYNVATSCHVHFLHNNVNAEDICGERQGQMLLHHGEEAANLLLLPIRIHNYFLDQFLQFRLAE